MLCSKRTGDNGIKYSKMKVKIKPIAMQPNIHLFLTATPPPIQFPRYRRRRTRLTDSGGFLLPLPPLPSLCSARPVPSSQSHHVLVSVFQRSCRRARKSSTVSRVTNTRPSSSTPPPLHLHLPLLHPASFLSFILPQMSPLPSLFLLNFVTKGTYFSSAECLLCMP